MSGLAMAPDQMLGLLSLLSDAVVRSARNRTSVWEKPKPLPSALTFRPMVNRQAWLDVLQAPGWARIEPA